MSRVLAAFLLLGLTGLAVSQDKDGLKDAPPKVDDKKFKGFLPMNFKKLGLSEKQTQAIYKIQADNRAKMDDLEAQLKKLKKAQSDEIEKVLTPEQRKRLDEIRTGKVDK